MLFNMNPPKFTEDDYISFSAADQNLLKARAADNQTADPSENKGDTAVSDKIIRSDQEWRKLLTPEQYRITRKKGTEQAFSGNYYNFKGKGIYLCVCCGNDLFSSETKFDSGSGWPSFWSPISEKSIITAEDSSFLMKRTEVLCRKCDAHLGHVFEDGPPPSGLRYCINSDSLKFLETK